MFYHENAKSEMNVINPTNTSGFCNKAVLLLLAACKYFTLKASAGKESKIIHAQYNMSLYLVAHLFARFQIKILY